MRGFDEVAPAIDRQFTVNFADEPVSYGWPRPPARQAVSSGPAAMTRMASARYRGAFTGPGRVQSFSLCRRRRNTDPASGAGRLGSNACRNTTLLLGKGRVGKGRVDGPTWAQPATGAAESGGVPPVRLDEASRSNRHPSQLERQRIATLRGHGLGVREIARRIDRPASMISRELRCSLRPHDKGRYDDLAQLEPAPGPARPRRAGPFSARGCVRWASRSSSCTGARSRLPITYGAAGRYWRMSQPSTSTRSMRRPPHSGRAYRTPAAMAGERGRRRPRRRSLHWSRRVRPSRTLDHRSTASLATLPSEMWKYLTMLTTRRGAVTGRR